MFYSNHPFARRLFLALLVLVTVAAWAEPARALRGEVRVLVCGFEPFGGMNHNPSQDVVELLAAEGDPMLPENALLKGVVLPVTYEEAWPRLEQAISDFDPHVVLCLGLAASARAIRLESVAGNLDRGYEDNEGESRSGPIVQGRSMELATLLPLEAMAGALSQAGIATEYSQDAGGYLCNHVFYRVVLEAMGKAERLAGFVHLPMGQVAGEQGLARAAAIMIRAILKTSIRAAAVEFEPTPDAVQANFMRMEQITAELAARNVDMVLFPEMAFLGLAHESLDQMLALNPVVAEDGGLARLSLMAERYRLYLGAGLAVMDGGRPYNAYVLFGPDGQELLRYRKNHLYGDDFNWAEPGGGQYPVADTPMGRVGLLICHDVVYREAFEPYIRSGTDLLIIGTNWIGPTPMSQYLFPWMGRIPAMLVSDRRGQEQGAVFYGNTQALIPQGPVLPESLSTGDRAAITIIAGP